MWRQRTQVIIRTESPRLNLSLNCTLGGVGGGGGRRINDIFWWINLSMFLCLSSDWGNQRPGTGPRPLSLFRPLTKNTLVQVTPREPAKCPRVQKSYFCKTQMMLETGFLGTEETVILTGYKPKLTAKKTKRWLKLGLGPIVLLLEITRISKSWISRN